MPFQFLKHYSIWGNTGWDYLIAILVFLTSLVALKLFEKIVISRLKTLSKKTENSLDDLLIDVVNDIGPLFYFVAAFFIAFQWLVAIDSVEKGVRLVFVIVAAREFINAVARLSKYGTRRYLEKNKENNGAVDVEHASTIMGMLRKALVVVLWLVLGTFILSNFGVNITSLVTGLGIGGIAIGLALQNVLGDIFSSISIFLDKPFKVGDFIQVGDDQGTVEKIGVKSTRIETLRGEELIISNQELTSTRIQNYSRTEIIRDSITIGVSYDTPKETLRKIPQMIESIIEGIEKTKFDRCRLNSFGDSAINFKVIYFVDTISFAILDEKKEDLNYAILEKFEEENIEFPFPTRTVHLQQE